MPEALRRVLSALESQNKLENGDLSDALRYCATNPASAAVLDNCERAEKVIKNVLELSLEGRADDDTVEPDLKRARLALRTLVNFCNRSTKFKTSATDDTIPLVRCLLRISELQTEVCAFLVAVVCDLHKIDDTVVVPDDRLQITHITVASYQDLLFPLAIPGSDASLEALLHKDYPALLADLASLWHIVEDNSWITAFFLTILETDFAFLSLAFRELSIDAFGSILEIAETILDSSETGEELKIHPNNVLYCVDFIERLLYDLGESAFKDAGHIPHLLISTIDIIGNCALRPRDYGTELLSKPRAIVPIVDVLEAVLDAQTTVEAREAEEKPRVKYPDRPEIQIPCRVPRVQEDKRLLALSAILVQVHEERGKLKCAAVRAIGNLCCDSLPNQQVAGQHGAVVSVLRCTKKRPDDKPFITQWAISALRHMIISCPENQDIVVSIDQQPTGILDRDRLLKELGVDVIKDDVTGKFKVKRVQQ